MPDLPEPLSKFFSVDTKESVKRIVSKTGYYFGTLDDGKITFFQTAEGSEERILIVEIDKIREILDPPLSEYFSFNYEKDGKLIALAYTGFPGNDSRSFAGLNIIPKSGGKWNQIATLIESNSDLARSVWVDDLNGKSYINLKSIGQKDQDLMIEERNIADLARWLEIESEKEWGKPIDIGSGNTLIKILENMAMKTPRNPFIEWVKSNTTGTELDNITIENLLYATGGRAPALTEEDEATYLKEVTLAFLLGVIERQFKPIRLDMALCLIGYQGFGKTNLCAFLGGGGEEYWYRVGPENVKDEKLFYEKCSGGVIVEFREGKQLKNPDSLKNHLDRTHFQFRKAYARYEAMNPIMFGNIITTNKEEALLDLSGNRRIAPIYYTGEKGINLAELPREIAGKLWKRAYEMYQNGESWRPHWNKVKDLAKKMQKYATVTPPKYDEIKEMLRDYNTINGPFIPVRDLYDRIHERTTFTEYDEIIKIIKDTPMAYHLIRTPHTKRFKNGEIKRYYIINVEELEAA